MTIRDRLLDKIERAYDPNDFIGQDDLIEFIDKHYIPRKGKMTEILKQALKGLTRSESVRIVTQIKQND